MSGRSAAKFSSLQVVPHPNSGPYHARPTEVPTFLRCDRRGRDQLHERHRRLVHLLHRHALAVVQVFVLISLRHFDACTAVNSSRLPRRNSSTSLNAKKLDTPGQWLRMNQ
jgi:hypothetical protein